MKLQFLLLDISDTFRRRRLYFLLPFVGVSLLGILAAYLIPEEFESFSTVMVRRDAAPVRPDAGAGADQLSLFTEIVHSRATLEAVVDTLMGETVAPGHPPVEEQVAGLGAMIRTEQRGSDACRITVEHPDPATARRIAEVVTEVSLRTSRQADRLQLDEAVKFFEQRLAEYGRSPDAREFSATSTGEVPAVPEESSLRAALGRAETDLNETDKSLALKERNVTIVASAMESLDEPATISRLSSLENRVAGAYAGEVRTQAVRYGELLTRYRPRHPEVQSARRQLLGLLQRTVETLKSEREQLQTRAVELRDRTRTLRYRIGLLAARTDTSHQQVRRANVSPDIVADLRHQLEQVRLTRDLHERAGSRFSVLDRPQRSSSPVRPDRPFIIGLGALLGFLLGLAGLMAAESLDPTIRRPRDLDVFGKPVIATLP
jgi:uncharacterized protein involved in exopolysaccharide biosynthesis